MGQLGASGQRTNKWPLACALHEKAFVGKPTGRKSPGSATESVGAQALVPVRAAQEDVGLLHAY